MLAACCALHLYKAVLLYPAWLTPAAAADRLAVRIHGQCCLASPAVYVSCNFWLFFNAAVSGEFVLTGLSNADGNSRNHEIGVCLPHFTLELTASCKLTIKPMHAGNAHISLIQVGEAEPGQHIIPRATDSVLAVNEYVTNKMGYYYLKTTRCPQIYQGQVKGAKLLASGG